jgi:DNA repair protein RecO (recombination protein O)
MSLHIIKTEALVLNALRWQESSKIVHLFSEDLGYIKIIAKGAFRPKSPFRGVMETLNHIETIISTRETRGLQILTSATLLDSYLEIREDLGKTGVAFSVLEMLKKLFSVHEPVKPFFQYIMGLFAALNVKDSGPAMMYLNHFLLQLSKTLGFGWTFEVCLNCKNIPEKFPVMPDYQNGGILCGSCRDRFPATGSGLSQKQWKRICDFSETEPALLPGILASETFELTADFSDLLLKHLTHHTEEPLELKSLKWYG